MRLLGKIKPTAVVFHSWMFSVSTATSLQNVTTNGTARQSSTDLGGLADRAIDGNKDPYFENGSCIRTALQQNPWWGLILPGLYRVTTIMVTTANNNNSINGAEILIGNSADNNGSNNLRCGVLSHIPGTQTFQCGGMEGRYINIYLPGYKQLTLCEVEVYAESISPPTFSAEVAAGRVATVVGKRLCWSDALFYCRDFYGDLLSLRSQEEQTEVQTLLSNATFNLTSNLWLGLRRYLMRDKWFWMSGDPMSYNHWKRGSPTAIESSPCGAMANGDGFLWDDYRCDDQGYFICLEDPVRATHDQALFFSTYRGQLRP